MLSIRAIGESSIKMLERTENKQKAHGLINTTSMNYSK